MRQEVINGRTVQVQEMTDWKSSIYDDFKPGDYFDADIAWELINAVPPHRFGCGYFQMGEPRDSRPNPAKGGKYCNTYLTLIKVSAEPEVWMYRGDCFCGEI